MPSAHRNLVASERHPVPRYEFATLGAAQGYTYSSSDVSCFVRVGTTGPYTHYLIVDVSGGVGELIEVGGSLEFGSPSALVPGNAAADGASGQVADAEHVHALPAFGTTAGTICEGDDERLIPVADYLTKYDIDVEPDPAAGDEMHADGIGGYAEWDERNYLTFAHDPARSTYAVQGLGDGTSDWGGLYTGIPNAVFSITAKVSLHGPVNTTGVGAIGVFVGNLTTPATGPARVVLVDQNTLTNGGHYFSSGSIANYQSNLAGGVSFVRSGYYVRLRVNGTTVHSDVSSDGFSWINISSDTAAFTPAHCGLVFRAMSNGNIVAGYWHWVRYKSGAGADSFFQVPDGRLIRVAPVA